MNKYGVLLVLLLPLGFLLAGCGDPPTKVGDVCQVDLHCGAAEDGFDLECDNGIPGGSCTVMGCTSDDPDTPAVDEDEPTCPSGSRCVREGETDYFCRRSCNQQSDCGEVIKCNLVCKEEDGEEVCNEECKNEMECSPFWDMNRDDVPEDAPRACIMKRALYREPTE